MRVIYQEAIDIRIHKEIDYARRNNKTIEYIYLSDMEWSEFRESVFKYTTSYYYPKRVPIYEPMRIEYSSIHGPIMPKNTFITEEVEYMGIKVRKEYK